MEDESLTLNMSNSPMNNIVGSDNHHQNHHEEQQSPTNEQPTNNESKALVLVNSYNSYSKWDSMTLFLCSFEVHDNVYYYPSRCECQIPYSFVHLTNHRINHLLSYIALSNTHIFLVQSNELFH